MTRVSADINEAGSNCLETIVASLPSRSQVASFSLNIDRRSQLTSSEDLRRTFQLAVAAISACVNGKWLVNCRLKTSPFKVGPQPCEIGRNRHYQAVPEADL